MPQIENSSCTNMHTLGNNERVYWKRTHKLKLDTMTTTTMMMCVYYQLLICVWMSKSIECMVYVSRHIELVDHTLIAYAQSIDDVVNRFMRKSIVFALYVLVNTATKKREWETTQFDRCKISCETRYLFKHSIHRLSAGTVYIFWYLNHTFTTSYLLNLQIPFFCLLLSHCWLFNTHTLLTTKSDVDPMNHNTKMIYYHFTVIILCYQPAFKCKEQKHETISLIKRDDNKKKFIHTAHIAHTLH